MVTESVLLVVQVVVSLFNIQLGNPVYQQYPMEKMEQCQFYADLMKGKDKLDIEYMLITQTKCVTTAEYKEMLAARASKEKPTNE